MYRLLLYLNGPVYTRPEVRIIKWDEWPSLKVEIAKSGKYWLIELQHEVFIPGQGVHKLMFDRVKVDHPRFVPGTSPVMLPLSQGS